LIYLFYVLKINPNSDTVSFFGSVSNDIYSWSNGVQAPNGYIYGIPYYQGLSILKINPNNDTVSTFGNWPYSGGWNGGCLDSNGRVFAPPYSSSTILVIDTNNDTYKTIVAPAAGASSAKWAGGVLAANGYIYCAPANATSILKIDPVNEIATTFGSFAAGSQKWMGIVRGINGKLYCIPGRYTTTTILCIDPSDDSYTEISGATGGGWYWGGGAVANNNDIYAAYTSGSVAVKPVLRILLENMK
jgi:streptogramin lyase